MESMPEHTNIFILRMTESYPRVMGCLICKRELKAGKYNGFINAGVVLVSLQIDLKKKDDLLALILCLIKKRVSLLIDFHQTNEKQDDLAVILCLIKNNVIWFIHLWAISKIMSPFLQLNLQQN